MIRLNEKSEGRMVGKEMEIEKKEVKVRSAYRELYYVSVLCLFAMGYS